MSRAQSRGTNLRDQRGVGHSGGGQSSSHHKRTNQGHNRSSPSVGPPSLHLVLQQLLVIWQLQSQATLAKANGSQRSRIGL